MRWVRRFASVFISFLLLSINGRPAAAQHAAVNGTLRLQVDVPLSGAVVTAPFSVSGWTLDQAAASGSGVDAVHAWALVPGGSPIFVGAATLGVARPDVAAAFGAQFARSGFTIATSAVLKPGTYTLAVLAKDAWGQEFLTSLDKE